MLSFLSLFEKDPIMASLSKRNGVKRNKLLTHFSCKHKKYTQTESLVYKEYSGFCFEAVRANWGEP